MTKKWRSGRYAGLEPTLHDDPECMALVKRAVSVTETDTSNYADYDECPYCHGDLEDANPWAEQDQDHSHHRALLDAAKEGSA